MRIHFYLDRRKGREKSLPVFLQYWHEGSLLRVFTGEHCDLDKWDKETERIKEGVMGGGVVNKLLASMEMEVVKIIREARIRRQSITVDGIRRKLTFVSGSDKDFFNVWDEFVASESERKGWSGGTVRRFQVVKDHLLKMNRFNRVGFQTVNEVFCKNFVKYHTNQGFKETYAKRNLDILKWFLKWAADNGYSVNMEYRKVRPVAEIEKADQIALTEDEIIKLMDYEPETEDSRLVKDMFLLGCMTGLGYSEISRFDSGNLKNEHIVYTPKRVNREVKVPLVQAARQIIEKNSNGFGKYLFNLPPIQHYNLTLKRIGMEAGLNDEVVIKMRQGGGKKDKKRKFKKWELLSSKVARKTFISAGAARGIGLEVMSELSGYHPETIKPFYHIKERSIKNEINKIDEIYNSGNTGIH